ncbi:coiled-coil domain-containing protein 13-like [Pogonomyrmex barbatus]|uniref:Coiled-coil domain-containing protein 13-like n=1 Tax=Pogonomyrmex barbatus TaxID=144034 RepID=A0A6I9VNA5_9HYME|nr:coiled-coil domain-containing protein 13-like [Pogonomyrmex barbatus]
MANSAGQLETNDSFNGENMPSIKLVEEELSERIIFPEELNKFLQDRIRDLTAENECLRRAFEQTEEKLRKLSQEKQNLQNAMPAELATTKLIELSKKYRDRTAEMEVLKTKCKNLEATLIIKDDELERQRKELQQIFKSEIHKDSCNKLVIYSHYLIILYLSCDCNVKEDENLDNIKEKDSSNSLGRGDQERIKCLKNKLQRVQAKLCESRNTCAALRQEINKAQKLLCSEVGENVSISALSSVPGGWRGRAEQIRNLQQKVAELQTRLSENEKSQKESSDRQNLTCLRNVERERRQQMENTAKELRQAEVALETSKRKLDAFKARIKILEQELSIAKGNITMLNEKRSHDDRLVDALNGRLKISEARYQEREVEVQNREHKIERESANIKNELRATQLHVERLRRRLEEREIEIDKLRNGTMDESFKCRTSLHPDFRPIGERSISPIDSSRSLGEPNEYVTLALAAEAERVRLLELVAVLNQRLDKERNEADALAELLRKEKGKCAKLESKLRDLEKEKVGLAKVNTGYRAKSCTKSMSSVRGHEETANPDEVRYKIELLEEECLALKARLDTVQQDKASDLATYKQMLEQTRKTFKDACRRSSQLPAIRIDVAATKPRYGDVTGTRDKVQRLHVNPRDTAGVKLTVSSPPHSSPFP